MLKYKNVRIMLVLLIAMFLYTFVLGCDGTVDNSVTVAIDGEEITITVKDDGAVEGADTAIEKVVGPVLDLGDAAVKAARDAEKGFLSDLFSSDDLSDLHGAGNIIDRSTQ